MRNRSNDPTAEIQIQTQQDPEWGGGSASVSLCLPFYKVRETQRKACATEEIHVPGSALPRPAAPRTRAPRQDLPPRTPVLLRELRLPPRERRAQRAYPPTTAWEPRLPRRSGAAAPARGRRPWRVRALRRGGGRGWSGTRSCRSTSRTTSTSAGTTAPSGPSATRSSAPSPGTTRPSMSGRACPFPFPVSPDPFDSSRPTLFLPPLPVCLNGG